MSYYIVTINVSMCSKCKKKSLQVCIMVDVIMYIFELAGDENKFTHSTCSYCACQFSCYIRFTQT